MADGDANRFGEQPLDQTVAAAAELRRLAGLLVSLEHANPTVDDVVAQCAEWQRALSASAPIDPTPRIEPDGTDAQRVYLSHAFDIGSYNPCFPEYRFDRIETDSAEGSVTFPVVYEGPPGLVHGGFLAVFFDCVIQHQNCATELSGKTRSLNVKFRRPTPLLTPLRFDISRAEVDRGITSTARLLLDDEVLCIGEATTLALAPNKLTGFGFGRRRA
jgi:acyl-coenzyme A thioesterase PaaI-like protein